MKARTGIAASAIAFYLAAISSAAAHHPMGGMTPETFVQGFLSGIGHPVIGLDHLAFIVAAGLAASMLPSGLALVGAFIAATALGTVLHLGAFDLPLLEMVIAASVVAAGITVARARDLSLGAALALFAAGGLFHGYAYGEAVIGAEPTPILAYLAGFALIQGVIAAGAMLALARAGKAGKAQPALRIAGGAVIGVGLVFLAQATLPF